MLIISGKVMNKNKTNWCITSTYIGFSACQFCDNFKLCDMYLKILKCAQ